jgi:hypothetical protein
MLSLAAAGMLVSAGALAQNASKTEPAKTDSANAAAQASDNGAQTGSGQAGSGQAGSQGNSVSGLRKNMKDMLQQAGFNHVRVVPDSFLVQARDKDGHPVAMVINPHSMTEVVEEGPAGRMAANGTGDTAGEGAQEQQGGTFTTVPKQEKLSSDIVGLSVYNGQHQDIGTIKDIAYGQGGVRAYIVGVGGFLGMGDRYVAVQPSAVRLSWDKTNKSWHATVDATASQLKSAPAYTYPNGS